MSEQSRALRLTFFAALVLVVGVADHLTGWELSFSIFYLVPVGSAAWLSGRRTSLAVALVAAGTWLFVDISAGHVYSHPLIPAWNAVVRFAFFAITAVLLANVNEHLHTEARMARTDAGTGLLNARAFTEETARVLAAASRSGRPFTLAFADLDNFKSVNDTLGHREGDRALGAVARALLRAVRLSDIVARVGGDEFAVLFPDAGRHEAERIARKLHEAVGARAKASGWPIGVSLGVVTFERPPADVDAAIAAADALMYRVKSTGKNRVLCATWTAGRRGDGWVEGAALEG